MAQPRRVQLTSLPTDVQSCAVNGAVLAPKSQPEPGGASPLAAHCGSGVIRLVVSLFEPDERSFAEFSYTQLLENKCHNVQDEVETRSRFEVGDQSEKQHMASSLMRNLEKKYKVKKKRDRVQDLIDIGYGYDDEDSFIDNSEAYDEFVPSSITTKFGGFYVNSGVLHFRQISDTETDDGTTGERTPKTTKKRELKDGQELPKKKRRRNVVPDKNGVDASSSMASDELMKKKKKKLSGTLSVTSMLKKFRREKELERKKMERTRQRMARTPLTPVTAQCPADTGGGSGLADPLLSLIGSTDEQALLQAASTVEFDIDLDCLLDVGDEIATPLMEPPPPEQQRAEHLPEASYDATLSPSRKMTQPQKPHPEVASSYQCVAMPEGLPPALEDSIKKLMLAAKTSEGESKLKFFTPEINAVLLDIERKCREHGGQLRSRVYTHLSFFLPCSKETLLKRVKKLKLAEGFSNVEDPMQKLKDAIARAMPEQITCFNQHCQEYEQVKTLRTMEDGSDVRQGGQGNNLEEKGTKRGGGPKKLFKWNEEIREVLHHVLREKLSVFQNKSDGRQQREEYLKTLLVKDVKPLWPKGWMQSRVLLSESRKILGLQLMFPKRSRSEKKRLSITTPSVSDQNTRPLPLKLELPYEANSVVEQASSASRVTTEDTEVIVLDSDSSPTPNDELSAIVCEQAPVHMDSQATPSELFAAAITKYKSSFQYWNLSVANGTPPLPPPPPQCSPVNFPEGGLCHVAVPKLQDLLGTPTDLGPDLQRGSDVIL